MEKSENDQVAFDYIKSNHFRVAHVDGVIGSSTPSGLIHIACYSERPAIPRRMVFHVAQDKVLGDEVADLRESKDSIVRELEIDLLVSITVAVSLRDWLDNQILSIEKMRKDVEGSGQ